MPTLENLLMTPMPMVSSHASSQSRFEAQTFFLPRTGFPVNVLLVHTPIGMNMLPPTTSDRYFEALFLAPLKLFIGQENIRREWLPAL